MNFDQYQSDAISIADYPNIGHNVIYPALGLTGEAGEVADKIKKLWRNCGYTDANDYHAGTKDEIVKELGDVLWYISALAYEMDISLNEIARINLKKLRDRKKRNVIKSEGDNR